MNDVRDFISELEQEYGKIMANVWQMRTPRNWCCAQRVTGCGGMRFGKSGGLGVLLCRTLDFAVSTLLDAYDISLADEGAEVVGMVLNSEC